MALSMIWAMARNRIIGKNNALPWHLPEDLKHFKNITNGKAVIMGLNTFKSLGKPLPNRRNIVINYEAVSLPGCEICLSIEDALSRIKSESDAFVIGGASIYRQFLPFAERLYMTYIDHDFEGDICFPEFDLDVWQLISEEKGTKDKENPYDYYFRVYERKKGTIP